MKRHLGLMLLLASLPCLGQGARFNNSLTTPLGQGIPGATVSVCALAAAGSPCSPTVTVYSDVGLSVPIVSPVSDGNGNVGFWIAPGNYQVCYSGASIPTPACGPVTIGGGSAVAVSDKQIIFSDGGVLTGDSTFLWDKTGSRKLLLGNNVGTGTVTCGGVPCDQGPDSFVVVSQLYTDPTKGAEGVASQAVYKPTGNSSKSIFGSSSELNVADGSTFNVGPMFGFNSVVDNWGSGTVNSIIGMECDAFNDGAGSTANLYCFRANYGGRATNLYGMYFFAPYALGSPTLNEVIHIPDVHGIAATNIGIRIADQGLGANDYVIKSEGGKSVFPVLNGAFSVDGTKYTTLQSAITAACAASPVAPVIVPPGTYAANTALTLCSGLSILGSGSAQADAVTCPTTITTTLASGDLFYLNAFNDIRITDLCIKTSTTGANAAIRLTAAQRNYVQRVYISGPFARGIQLDSSSTATASTIWNNFSDIHITGLAANGIGCLLDSKDASTKVINGNNFTNVRCTGGTGGVGLKLTNSNQAQVINENVINCSECLATTGTGILIDQGATSDLVLIAPTVEGSTTGFNKATANTVSIYGGKVASNGTNVTDAQPLFTSFINTLVGGVTQQFSVSPLGDIAVSGISIGGAAIPAANIVNGAAGAAWQVSGTTLFTANAANLQVAGTVGTNAIAFGSLPTCDGSHEGQMRAVTDSSTAVWGATITNGGANHVLGYCNGTNWTVAAK